ncbi:hypothetical protein NHQ30_001453 [Ciborinia camelliae]|nr:hypothetical protein NHQ30_001453 [Ciborinia camelliae]
MSSQPPILPGGLGMNYHRNNAGQSSVDRNVTGSPRSLNQSSFGRSWNDSTLSSYQNQLHFRRSDQAPPQMRFQSPTGLFDTDRTARRSCKLQSQYGASRSFQPIPLQPGAQNPSHFQPQQTATSGYQTIQLQSPESQIATQHLANQIQSQFQSRYSNFPSLATASTTFEPVQLRPQYPPPHGPFFPASHPNPGMHPNILSRWDSYDEAEAQEELRNPRGQPSGYTDPRQDPAWRQARSEKAIQIAGERINKYRGFRGFVQGENPMPHLSTFTLDNVPPPDRGPPLATSPQRGSSSRVPQEGFKRQRLIAGQFQGYEDPHDREMAKYQLAIDNMDMSSAGFSVQDEWAKSQLRKIGYTCARGCRWTKVQGGYRCDEGFHWVTNQMVSEGKGEVIWFMPSGRDPRAVPNGFPNQPASYIPPGCDRPRLILPPGHKSLFKKHGDGGRIKH